MKNKYLFLALMFLTFVITGVSSAQKYDTTFSANLNNDAVLDRIKVSYKEDASNRGEPGYYEIAINGIVLTDSVYADPYFTVEMFDIDKADMFDEIFVKSGMNDYNDYNVYRFDGRSIIKLGNISCMNDIKVLGNRKIEAKEWMGFWSYDYEYIFNPSTQKFDVKKNDLYDIKMFSDENDITVDTPFAVYTDRVESSAVKFEIKKDENIKILKAYINVICPDEYTNMCVWYLIENNKGEQGWAMLKDFMEKVSGIPWAG
jgi:hypothetical protein